MRTCADILKLAGVTIGILGILAGCVKFITPTVSVSDYGNIYRGAADSGTAILIIASSIISWLILYGFGSALHALADIQEDTRKTLDNSARNLLANDRMAEAVERLVAMMRRSLPQETIAVDEAESPDPPSLPVEAPPKKSATIRSIIQPR